LMVDITDASAKICKHQRDKSKQAHLSQNGPTRIIGSFLFALNRCNPNDDPIIRTTDSASIKGVPLEHVEPTRRMHILRVILLRTYEHWSSLQLCSTMKLMNQIMKEATEVHLTMKCSMVRLVTSTSNKTPPCIIQTKITRTLLLFCPCGPRSNQENDEQVASNRA